MQAIEMFEMITVVTPYRIFGEGHAHSVVSSPRGSSMLQQGRCISKSMALNIWTRDFDTLEISYAVLSHAISSMLQVSHIHILDMGVIDTNQ
jgi:hypothetical protein